MQASRVVFARIEPQRAGKSPENCWAVNTALEYRLLLLLLLLLMPLLPLLLLLLPLLLC